MAITVPPFSEITRQTSSPKVPNPNTANILSLAIYELVEFVELVEAAARTN
jgi:hypothetical protein